MKKIFFLCSILGVHFSFAQDFSFTYVKTFNEEKEISAIYDSIQKPLLITENKIYVIGSACILYSLMGGTYYQRDKNGKINRRNKSGFNDERYSDGGSDERLSGGSIADRTKSGKNDRRNKNGDTDKRRKDGNSDNRNSGGTLSDAPRCEVADNGKLILYTRQEIKAKASKIYYKQQFFNDKYFKINTL